MKNNEETVTSEQFFDDIMQGFEEASQYARGQADLRVTHVEIIAASPVDTIVNIDAEKSKTDQLSANRPALSSI